jgi:probable F420-dependent oxidoreductase
MAKPPSFGAQLAALPPGEGRALARSIEGLGYDSLWVPDHLSFHYPIYEAMTHLAFMAASTERVRLGTAVFLLPLRSAGLAAKQVATADALSGGRVILGVGIGGEARVEYDLCGVPRNERGARASEAIRVMKLLWSGEATDFVGRFSRFKGAKIDPPPVQKGGPPVWVGGRSPAALKRAALLGDGYVSYVLTPERIRGALETIRREAESAGRALDDFESAHLFFVNVKPTYEEALEESAGILTSRYRMDFREPSRKYNILGPPAACAEQLARYLGAGVRHFILSPTVPREALEEQFETLAREVIPAIGPAIGPALEPPRD